MHAMPTAIKEAPLAFGSSLAVDVQYLKAKEALHIEATCTLFHALPCCVQDMGLEFKGLDGGTADPLLVTIVANIIFDTRYSTSTDTPSCGSHQLGCNSAFKQRRHLPQLRRATAARQVHCHLKIRVSQLCDSYCPVDLFIHFLCTLQDCFIMPNCEWLIKSL